MTKTVIVREQFYIKHSWSDCHIESVQFLKNAHVHKMFITVEVAVEHGNRAVEFFVLRSNIIDAFTLSGSVDIVQHHIYQIGGKSMEMIAQMLFNDLQSLGYKVVSVECSEDGFFSGKVYQQ